MRFGILFSLGFVFENYSSVGQFAYRFNDPALTISAYKGGSIGFGGFLLACILTNEAYLIEKTMPK
jgi:hypothetical protein